MLAALDCADEANQQVCSNFGITGFPTLKVKAMHASALFSPCCAFLPVPLLLNLINSAVALKYSL